MNTVDMLTESSTKLGYSTSQTSALAQRLYTNGFITYPRTSSRKYNAELPIDKMLISYSNVGMYKEEAKALLNTDIDPSILLGEGEYQDHPPITPAALPKRHKMIIADTPTAKLHRLIMTYFFATLSEDAKVSKITTKFDISGHEFTKLHSHYVKQGFTKFYDLNEETKKQLNFSNLKFDDQDYEIVGFRFQKWKASPPKYLSESELVKLMEAKKIGTDGTIPDHIRKIILRKYVTVKEGTIRRYIPTGLGIGLANGFKHIDSELIEPVVRGYIERCCQKISNYEMGFQSVIDHLIKTFRAKLIVFNAGFKHIIEELKGLDSFDKAVKDVISLTQKFEAKRQGFDDDYLLEEATISTCASSNGDEED